MWQLRPDLQACASLRLVSSRVTADIRVGGYSAATSAISASSDLLTAPCAADPPLGPVGAGSPAGGNAPSPVEDADAAEAVSAGEPPHQMPPDSSPVLTTAESFGEAGSSAATLVPLPLLPGWPKLARTPRRE